MTIYFLDCCSKVYVSSSGNALKHRYDAFGNYYEIKPGSEGCERLKDVPGCDPSGKTVILHFSCILNSLILSECLCNGRTVWIQREHISGKVINERQHFLYFFVGDGLGQWSIAQTLNAANFLIGKESVNLCPHANDEIRWKYLSYRGTIENDDRSLDVGCGKFRHFLLLKGYHLKFLVGECILTQTNNNTIGSKIKLKDGAETEVARFQYQMGKKNM